MTEHRKNGPIRIPIESDDDVFEIDADADDFPEDFSAPTEDEESDPFVFDASPDLAVEEPADDESVEAVQADEPVPFGSTEWVDDEDIAIEELPSVEAVPEGPLSYDDLDPYIPPAGASFVDAEIDPYVGPVVARTTDDALGEGSPKTPTSAQEPFDEEADESAQPRPAAISREAVFEMMQELRQKSEQIARMTDEKSDFMDRLLRKQAEFENFRRRGEREMQESYGRARADLMGDLLPVLDNFDLAVQHADTASPDVLREGIQLIYRQLMDTLGRLGLEPIEADGQPFDPEFHEAVATEPNEEVPDHTVVGVLQRGFKLGDRLLRPARVKVAVQP